MNQHPSGALSHKLPAPTDLILVVVLPHPRDLEIARLLGWYRIPLRSAPKVVAVDWVAFYQPATFGEDKWRIRWVAPVLGHELARRYELLRDEPDHPRAQDEYYKLQLGPLRELPQPIGAGSWRRLTFLYTTGEYLLEAEQLTDLVVESEERPILWQALRERAQQYSTRPAADLPALDLDPLVLAALLGVREAPQAYIVGEED